MVIVSVYLYVFSCIEGVKSSLQKSNKLELPWYNSQSEIYELESINIKSRQLLRESIFIMKIL